MKMGVRTSREGGEAGRVERARTVRASLVALQRSVLSKLVCREVSNQGSEAVAKDDHGQPRCQLLRRRNQRDCVTHRTAQVADVTTRAAALQQRRAPGYDALQMPSRGRPRGPRAGRTARGGRAPMCASAPGEVLP